MISIEVGAFIPVVSKIKEKWGLPLVAKVNSPVRLQVFVKQVFPNFLVDEVAW